MNNSSQRARIAGLAVFTLAGLAASLHAPLAGAASSASPPPATVTVFASGLNNPRGLKFGPNGVLYVAEGGVGGTDSTVGLCDQVVTPVGPYTGSPTGGRISRIGPTGYRDTVTDNLPSSQNSPDQGSSISGVADIAFIGDTLYGLLAGAGCSHGVSSVPNGVVSVGQGGRWRLTADLSAFQAANPTQDEDPADFEPDGVWWGMVEVGGNLYAVEPNHGELDRIAPDGAITRVADISASQGHIVPTAVAWHNGAFYVGNLGTFPTVDGSSKVLRITMKGEVSTVATGFENITGLAFDRSGRLYVLQSTTGNPFPTPNTGNIVRVGSYGAQEVIASGLLLPTAMAFGPGGSLYVSVGGYGLPPTGLGQVLKIDLLQ